MRSNIELPKSVKEENLLNNIKYPEPKTVYELAVAYGVINKNVTTKTLNEWTCLSDKQLAKIKNNLKVELGLAIIFCVGVGAKYEQTKKIIWNALGFDLNAPPLFDYDFALRKACSIEETDIGDRVYCVTAELKKRNVPDRCLN